LILCAGTLISSPVSSSQAFKSDLPFGVTVDKAKWETFTAAVTSSGGPAGPGSEPNPNRVPLPTQSTTTTVVRTRLYVYSIELSNNGAKAIKALSWDFVFTDPTSNTELRRVSLVNLQKIDAGQKKTVGFTTQASPPKVVTAAGLEKSKSSPFNQSASLKCILFADDSIWEQPNAGGKACDRLHKWLERRKKWQPGLEDLPLTP
jgi:hypothetical protein